MTYLHNLRKHLLIEGGEQRLNTKFSNRIGAALRTAIQCRAVPLASGTQLPLNTAGTLADMQCEVCGLSSGAVQR